MSGEIVFVNGAIQNRGFDLDEQPGKIAGIMVSRAMNHLHGNCDAIHLWNNVGAFNAAEPDDTKTRLAQKYDARVMKDHLQYWQHDASPPTVLADDDNDFADWADTAIAKLLEQGQLKLEKAAFHACDSCETVIAEVTAPVGGCKQCGDTGLHSVEETGLFLDTPADKTSLLAPDRIYNPMNLRREQDSLKQVPDRLLLSRDRREGVHLTSAGLPEKVLDPRLGIGLLAVYAAEIGGYEQAGLVQSIGTLIRTAPYIGPLDLERIDAPDVVFVPHTKIDFTALPLDDADTAQFVAPLAATQRNQAVTAGRLAQARTEHQKLRRTAAALETILDRLKAPADTASATMPPDRHRLNDVLAGTAKHSGRVIETLKRVEIAENEAEKTAVQDAHRLLQLSSRLKARPT